MSGLTVRLLASGADGPTGVEEIQRAVGVPDQGGPMRGGIQPRGSGCHVAHVRALADGIHTAISRAVEAGHGQDYLPELARIFRKGAEGRRHGHVAAAPGDP